MPDTPAFRVSDLPQNEETAFDLRPEPEERAALAHELGLLNLKKLSFRGRIRASGRRDWHLSGMLGATVVQPCVVTLDPVTTRIDAQVERTFVADLAEPEMPEVEMPEDETVEPLGSHIDPAAIMAEALSLALPLYPRSEGSALQEANFAGPGITPLRDEDTKPFAGLAGLRKELDKKG